VVNIIINLYKSKTRKLKLNPYGDGKDNSEFVSLNLCNLDVQENIYPIQIPINFVLYIRNKDNFDRKGKFIS